MDDFQNKDQHKAPSEYKFVCFFLKPFYSDQPFVLSIRVHVNNSYCFLIAGVRPNRSTLAWYELALLLGPVRISWRTSGPN